MNEDPRLAQGGAEAHDATIATQSNPGTRPAKAHVAAHNATVVTTTNPDARKDN